MHFNVQNVNDAFTILVSGIHSQRISTDASESRVGSVLRITEPVIVSYTRPTERVLFNRARDSNCFFTLYESLWMLAGRQDIAPLDYYSSGYSKQVQDGDSPNANGAYGYRWRNHRRNPQIEGLYNANTIDQLAVLIDHIKRKPETRRAVLQMWTVDSDLLKVDSTKDTCCNLSCVFQTRGDNLDMTVYNRSNDIVWGMLGANAVHFSFLQEYVAACVGRGVGRYHQVSCDAHVYTERFEPEKWLTDTEYGTPYPAPTYPLVKDPATFDAEVVEFVERHSKDACARETYTEPFLKNVAQPMMLAFHKHKQRDYPACLRQLNAVAAPDWRMAGWDWVQKRMASWAAKEARNALTGVE